MMAGLCFDWRPCGQSREDTGSYHSVKTENDTVSQNPQNTTDKIKNLLKKKI